MDNIFVERLWRTVKYEEVYLKQQATLQALSDGLMNYFAFYNTKRPHQSLGYKMPNEVYRLVGGSGAKIVDKNKASTTKQMPNENRG